MNKRMLLIAGLLAGLCAAGCESKGGFVEQPPSQRMPVRVAADDVKFPATLSDGKMYTMSGYFAYGDKARPDGGAVIVALHGASYNSTYFNAKAQGQTRYSFADAMINGEVYLAKSDEVKADPSLVGASLPVLALDDFGAGKSSKPGGVEMVMTDFLSIEESALGLHQILTSLKTVNNPLKIAFDTIVIVCHSKGCPVAIKTLSDHQGDADLLVLTAFAVSPHAPPPALLDPRVQMELGKLPWPKYPDDLRRGLFYNLPDADPAVITYDNTILSDTVGRLQLIQLGGYFMDTRPLAPEKVTVPVFQVLSNQDTLYPSTLGPQDQARFTGAKTFNSLTLTDAGHSFFLHKDASAIMLQVNAWIGKSLPKQ